MKSATQVRVLCEGDAASMRRMLDVFGQAFDDSAYTKSQPSDDYLKRLLARPDFIAMTAVREGEIVGGIVAYVLTKFEQARSEAYIYDIAVAPAFRRQGIATALIPELQRVTRLRGVEVIYVQADCDDEPAVALYSRLGKKTEVFHFDIADQESSL